MEAKSYNDASWETVSAPHSATYAAPVHSAEQKAIGAMVKSDFCYRKRFYRPPTVRKMFIHFGAIMQTATVYVNGTAVGSYSNSGYTAFFFDISNVIARDDTNIAAIRCNAGLDGSIPPGGDSGQTPDFELFSGMYRDVHLICKDNSRFARQVAMIKAMGINSIRCSHYPRSRAFYDARDSLGMPVLCESPSWGCGGTFKCNAAFWNRMYACDSAMVLEAYNHPSIYGWVLFNEATESNLGHKTGRENSIIHALDPLSGSGRVTLAANIQGGHKYTFDVLGLNYDESTSSNMPSLNTEAYGNAMKDCDPYGNWYRNYVRSDIRFVKSDGTPLPYEIERWDPADQRAEVWVLVDTVYGNRSDQYITMYWGNPDAKNGSIQGTVFNLSNGFAGVWHLSESSGTRAADASSNGFHGTYKGGLPRSAGCPMGVCQNITKPDSDYVDMGDVLNTGLQNISIGVWIKRASFVTPQAVIAKTKGDLPSKEYGFLLSIDPADAPHFSMASGGARWGDDGAFDMAGNCAVADTTTWHYVFAVIDRTGNSKCRMYIDGVDRTGNIGGDVTKVATVANTFNLRIGTESDNNYSYLGSIAEVTIAFKVRSADWVKLSYMNRKEQDALIKW